LILVYRNWNAIRVTRFTICDGKLSSGSITTKFCAPVQRFGLRRLWNSQTAGEESRSPSATMIVSEWSSYATAPSQGDVSAYPGCNPARLLAVAPPNGCTRTKSETGCTARHTASFRMSPAGTDAVVSRTARNSGRNRTWTRRPSCATAAVATSKARASAWRAHSAMTIGFSIPGTSTYAAMSTGKRLVRVKVK